MHTVKLSELNVSAISVSPFGVEFDEPDVSPSSTFLKGKRFILHTSTLRPLGFGEIQKSSRNLSIFHGQHFLIFRKSGLSLRQPSNCCVCVIIACNADLMQQRGGGGGCTRRVALPVYCSAGRPYIHLYTHCIPYIKFSRTFYHRGGSSY